MVPLDAVCIEVARQGTEYVARSPDWPDLTGFSEVIPQAVEHLLLEVEGSLPLGATTIAALRAVGGQETVDAWDASVRGVRCLELRDAGDLAGELVRKYVAAGHTPTGACAWAALRVEPRDALAVERLGMDADAFNGYKRTYAHYFEDASWWWGRDAPSAEEWALALVPVDRAHNYLAHDVTLEEAADGWEPLIARTRLPNERLNQYLTLRMSPEEAADHEQSEAEGVDIDAALELLLALRQAPPTPYDDPPF